jgi:hypothetical protein
MIMYSPSGSRAPRLRYGVSFRANSVARSLGAAGKIRLRNHCSALEKDPVSCALMSGLLRGVRRWPSWVYADVSGTNLSGVLEAHGC